ncbi:hypothetical protein EYZ11_001034 [Aspergillus tanneri]|uniref:Fe2OG dioxygenase domain-containing protein n=1 Tax=Aspergillus tanneri TaxID=1220188 RepID=A0A4S3JVN8_9EURO|nr:uncharacterized protein ATNIH1004_011421 [Aspergillus tanneri]KAA8642476.1 hypothetical protein ATNIH1004_011421 [Aspergillus tanneri]THC99485.1 hypothetical protein EYZ11_001034 [Aspergillus tanneri]
MPTPRLFDQCPAFPSALPVIPLPIVSFQKLQNNSFVEAGKLYEACQQWGFFLLDLRNSDDGATLLQDAEKMFELTEETFHLDKETLDQYAYNAPKDLTGYKRMGKLKTDDGKMDFMELYSINQDDMLGRCHPRKNPGPIEARRKEIAEFIQHSNKVLGVILNHLDIRLGLKLGTLGSLSPLNQDSETSVRLLHSQQQSNPQYDRITLGGHTDIGTMTLLFNIVGGLQILPAGSDNRMDNWKYIKPELGCALVNVGDTLVEWTGGLLRSSLHRVMTAPGEQALVPRQSVAYLVRPRQNASMCRLKSSVIPTLTEGEKDEKWSVNEWAAWRTKQIMLGELKPQTIGGKPLIPL